MLCQRAFARKSNLIAHEATHNGEKPFPCTEPGCSKSFSRRFHLKRHRKQVHLKEKPHKCPHCPRAFAQANNLRVHVRTHTGEAPFRCKHCGHAWKDKRSMVKHNCKAVPVGPGPFRPDYTQDMLGAILSVMATSELDA